jgi:Nuclear pore protein 84 / 107
MPDPIPSQESVLRFTSHLIRFMHNAAGLDIDVHAIKIVRRYIDLLKSENAELIPFFLQLLPYEAQIDAYVSFLQDVEDDKIKFYKLGKEYGVDMKRVAIGTVESIFKRGGLAEHTDLDPTVASVADSVSHSDMIQIRTLEWLTFDADMAVELLKYSNYLIRLFLLHGKLHAVNALTNMYTPAVEEDSLALNERFQYSLLIECHTSYDTWAALFKGKKGVNWHNDVLKQTDVTIDLFRKLLDGDLFGVTFQGTGADFLNLRRIYTPDIVLLHQHILLQTCDLVPRYNTVNVSHADNVFELCVLVANTQGCLYLPFAESGKLKKFLQGVKDTAMIKLKKGISGLAWCRE